MNKIDPFNYLKLEDGEIIIMMHSVSNILDIIPNRYYISNYGRIFYCNKKNNYQFKEMQPAVTRDGYLQVSLIGYNGKHSYKVSRLVLYFFVGVPDYINYSRYDANHKDYNRQNNRLDNLEWLTHTENILYSYDNMRKITDDAILDIYDKINNKNMNPEIVAKQYNVAKQTIIDVAHGTKYYKDRLAHLGLENKCKLALTTKDIIEIYKKCLKGIPDEIIAKEYNIHKLTVGRIRLKRDHYKNILKNFPDLEIKTNNKFSKEEALRIHYEIVNSNLTTDQLAKKYNISTITLRDLKFCVNGYSYLIDEFNVIPPKKSNNNNKTDTETAIKIYKMAENGMKSKEIHEETGMSIDAINDIKFCRDGFEYLTEQYGLQPIPHRDPKGNIIIDKKNFSNKMPEDIYLKRNKFDIPEALIIYNKLSHGATYRDIANEYNCDNTDVIIDIKKCRGGYKYLKDKYGLEPIGDKENDN